MSAHWEFLVAAFGVVTLFWNQTKAFIAWMKGWVVVSKKHDWPTGLLMVSYLEATTKRVSTQSGTYASVKTFVRPLDRIYRVIFQTLHGTDQTFWRAGRPIWFGAKPVGHENSVGNRADYFMTFSFLRGSHDWEKLLLQAADWEAEVERGSTQQISRFRVEYHFGTGGMGEQFMKQTLKDSASNTPEGNRTGGHDGLNGSAHGLRILGWTPEDVRGSPVISPMENLSLRPELVSVVDEVKFWHASQAWYQKHGVPWRRGLVFHGGPGTGKTSLARAIAELLDMPVHVFDLAGMSNQDLKRAWRSVLSTAPCIVLFEDIDAVFEGRKNIIPASAMGGGGLTFDTLLNCLDGIERADGVLTIVSTNRIGVLDDALINRPGRIDRVIEFKTLDHEGRVKLATRILDSVERAIHMAMAYPDDSAAQFQERCFREALAHRFSDCA